MTIRNLEFVLSSTLDRGDWGEQRRGLGGGQACFEECAERWLRGPVYLVNPKHRRIVGRDCFLSIDELPAAPELTVIATPPDTIPFSDPSSWRRGTRATVVITAGLGPELRQECSNRRGQLVFACRPEQPWNCRCLRLESMPISAWARPAPGKLAFLSQSGALVGGVLDWAGVAWHRVFLCRVPG